MADEKLPATFKQFVARFPELSESHSDMAKAADQVGPLDAKTRELIKIGISLGAGLESATKSHVRRAAGHGASTEEMEQAIMLGMTTCGFPKTVAAWWWMQAQLERDRSET